MDKKRVLRKKLFWIAGICLAGSLVLFLSGKHLSSKTLWIMWMVEIGILIGYVFFVCLKDIKDLIVVFVYPIISVVIFTYVPLVMFKDLLKRFSKYSSSLQYFLGKAVWVSVLVELGVGMIIFAIRHYAPRVSRYGQEKKRKLYGERRQEEFPKHNYDPGKYFTDDEKYFIGLTPNEIPVPIRMDQQELTMHMLATGPTGMGKTTFLMNMIAQANKKGIPVIFIDGKGELDTIKKIGAINTNAKVFCPARPEFSNTYNPLACTQDPNELKNLIVAGMEIKGVGESKVYSDSQKDFLGRLLPIFISAEERVTFANIVRFMDEQNYRLRIYKNAKDSACRKSMEDFLAKMPPNERDLMGLRTDMNSLFATNKEISKVINTSSQISIKDVFRNGGMVLFSLVGGIETHEALGRMIVADISNATIERHIGLGKGKRFVLVILDEFGFYVSEYFTKFITTARSANVACILSYQTNAQLEATYYMKENLGKIVRGNTNSRGLFRQREEAEFWSKDLGTQETQHRTEQVETGALFTERIAEKGTIKPEQEFLVHPNVFKKLKKGQMIWQSGINKAEVVNIGELNLDIKDIDLLPNGE